MASRRHAAGRGMIQTPDRPVGALETAREEPPAGPGPVDVRWQDARGHFLPNDAIQSEDIIDPGAYYGVSSRIWATCSVCGREVEDPRCIVVGLAP